MPEFPISMPALQLTSADHFALYKHGLKKYPGQGGYISKKQHLQILIQILISSKNLSNFYDNIR